MKQLTFLLFLSLSTVNFSQRTNIVDRKMATFETSSHFLDTSKNTYEKKKFMFLKMMDENKLNPFHINQFLAIALKNDDVKFYKSQMSKFIKEYGFFYSENDTLNKLGNYDFNGPNLLFIYIKLKKVHKWTIAQCKKYYPEWEATHKTESEIRKKIDHIYDELLIFRQIYGKFKNSKDTIGLYNMYKIKHEKDLQSLSYILSFTREQGALPNDFQNGVYCEYKIREIVFGLLDSKETYQTYWDIIFPKLEKAYLDGLITDQFFVQYDSLRLKYEGCQYFGLIPHEMICEKDTYQDRVSKYGLFSTVE